MLHRAVVHKAILLALLLVVSYGQVGYLFHAGWLQFWAKEAARDQLSHTLPDSALTRVALADIIDWEAEGEEFWWQGGLYDVAREQTLNHQQYVLALRDVDEGELVTLLKTLNDEAQSPAARKWLVSWLHLLEITLPQEWQLPNNLLPLYAARHFPAQIDALEIGYPESTVPPPQR